MKATPIIAGRAYRVTYQGRELIVIAENAAMAIVKTAEAFWK